MKSTKRIILSSIIVFTISSCNSDRDDDVTKSTISQKSELKSLKMYEVNSNVAKSDSSTVRPNQIKLKEQNEESSIVDPTKPDKPW